MESIPQRPITGTSVVTKFLPVTNFKGARIKAKTVNGHSITISYPHQYSGIDCHRPAAIALIKKLGWDMQLVTESNLPDNGYVFIFQSVE